MNGNHLESWRP